MSRTGWQRVGYLVAVLLVVGLIAYDTVYDGNERMRCAASPGATYVAPVLALRCLVDGR